MSTCRNWLIASLAVALAVSAGAASRRPIGAAGGWAGTIAAAALGGKIYTVESGGALYVTDPASGTWQALGSPDFAATAFLFACGEDLVTIEKDGSLYVVSPADGSWRKSGSPGEWKNTIAGAVLGGALYTVESGGALYATDPASGTWRQIGQADFANTKFLFATGGKLVSIEKDGSLYVIDPSTGAWERSGAAGAWSDLMVGAASDTGVYTIDSAGTLKETDAAAGSSKTLGAEFSGAVFLVCAGGEVYGIDTDGNLFGVGPGGEAAEPAAAAPAPSERAAAPAEEEGENDPALAGQLTFKFTGRWQGDTDPFEADPEFQKQKAAAPEMVQALVSMMQGMKMHVTLDGIEMEVMGEKAGPFRFSVVSAFGGNTLVIVNEDGPKQGVKSKIVFTDDRHIQVIEQTPEGKAMFFKKE